jgi:hypothetical protein
VDIAFLDRQTRYFGNRGKDRLAVLRWTPDLALLWRIKRGGVHRLHRRVALVWIAIDRLHYFRRTCDRRLGIARLVPDKGLVGVEPLLQHVGDCRAADPRVRALVPHNRQGRECGLGIPEIVGENGNSRVADGRDLLDAPHVCDVGGVEAFHLTARYRAVPDRCGQHAGKFQVDAVDQLAIDLVGGIEPLQWLAGYVPVLRVFELDRFRRIELRRRLRDLAKSRRLAGWLVRDDAVGGVALLSRDAPACRCGSDQHVARGRTAFADILVRVADPAAAAGGQISPYALARGVRAWRREFGCHLRPIAFQLLGNQLREAGHRALSHFGARNPDDDRVVRADNDPGVHFLGAVGRLRGRDIEWNTEA